MFNNTYKATYTVQWSSYILIFLNNYIAKNPIVAPTALKQAIGIYLIIFCELIKSLSTYLGYSSNIVLKLKCPYTGNWL